MNEENTKAAAAETLMDVAGYTVDCEYGLRSRISTIGDTEKIDWGVSGIDVETGAFIEPIDGGDSGEGSVEFDRAADGRRETSESSESSEVVEIVDFGVYAGKAGWY
jgi:hypothetical protein